MTMECKRATRSLFLFLVLGALAVPVWQPAEAQVGTRIKNRIKRDAERRIENRAVEVARRTLDLAEDAIVCAVTDEKCIEEARQKGKEPVVVDKDGKPVSGYEPATKAHAPGQGVWANYNFVAGDSLLFVHDFEGTRTGNFPSRIGYIAGNLDVVRLGSEDEANKVLRIGEGTSESGGGGNGCFTIPLPEMLPERFTLEFRVMTTDPLRRANLQLFSDGSDDSPDTRCNYPPNPHVFVNGHEQGLQFPGGYGAGKAAEDAGMAQNEWMIVALGCDGPYCKMFVNGKRVANVPQYEFPRAAKLHVFMNVYRYSLFVDDFRIAQGGARSLYDDLESAGFISTTAVRFDTGSAVLKPESTGILNDVLAMMQDHDDVHLLVEGHTDSQGSDASNQTLSEQRAEAVVAWLIDQGIEAGRLDTVGYGESRPAADNKSPEGMAQNRRVVFRKQG